MRARHCSKRSRAAIPMRNHEVQAHASDIGRAAYDAQHRVPMDALAVSYRYMYFAGHKGPRQLEAPGRTRSLQATYSTYSYSTAPVGSVLCALCFGLW